MTAAPAAQRQTGGESGKQPGNLGEGTTAMAQALDLPIPALTHAELQPIVAQVLDLPQVDVAEWHVTPVAGAAGSVNQGGRGLFRVQGQATAQVPTAESAARADRAGAALPWSVVVKVFGTPDAASTPGDTTMNPTAADYWQREILTYRSGMLAGIHGGLTVPRCYGVVEHAQHEWRVWLEDVAETSKIWTLTRHSTAARHLGRFNGAYLAGRPLPPAYPWLCRGRTREWAAAAGAHWEGFAHYAASAGRSWLSAESVTRMRRLLGEQERILRLLGGLPVCLCHHDAYRRNLIARDRPGGEQQTVAVDWSMVGFGGIGEESGIMAAATLTFLDVPAAEASAYDDLVFASYLTGLRDAGWAGDARLARFGHTATAALTIGTAMRVLVSVNLLGTPEGVAFTESAIGHDIDACLAQWATLQPFLLDLGDEALQLANELD